MDNNDEILLSVRHLCQYFPMGAGRELKAVDDVSFDIKKGEAFGLVGESGCGKTTTGRSIIKLYDITSGDVYFKGQRICAGTRSYKNEIKKARADCRAELAARKAEHKKQISDGADKGALEYEFVTDCDKIRAKYLTIITEKKRQIKLAKRDHKNCEKIYLEKLKSEYKTAVLSTGSRENLSDAEKAKYRPVEMLPRIPKKNWIIGAVITFMIALAFLITSIVLFVQHNNIYGHYNPTLSVVLDSDATAGTTTISYSVDNIEYNAVIDYYDENLGVSTPEQKIRLRVYYDENNPEDIIVTKPDSPMAIASLAIFISAAVVGVVILFYVNERYNPSRLVTQMQMIFQDPIASLNPRMTVRDIIAEGLVIAGEKDKKYIDEQVYKVLELVGLVREHAGRYPHEFSGGQRQRIGIARSVIMEPDLIIADEPVSALDVSIQAQVINLLNELKERLGLTIMFIAHDLSVVKYFSDRIGVMYFGKMVELASSDELFAHPLHPYTRSLLSAIPLPDPEYEKNRKRFVYNPLAEHDYSTDGPVMREVCPGHFVYCNQVEFDKYREQLEA